jgi:AcrR family transcriptional regulator
MTDSQSFYKEGFMAIIVDKVKKRETIACSCKELLLKEGFNSISISKITKTAGISKGSFYDYFENKEDLVFEVLSHLIDEYNKKLQVSIDNTKSIKDKIKALTAFFYKDEFSELREIYKQFASISLMEKNSQIAIFQQKNHKFYKDWVDSLINQGIKRGELKEDAINITEGIFASIKGFYLSYTIMQKLDNLEEQITIFLDEIFKLIEVKK